MNKGNATASEECRKIEGKQLCGDQDENEMSIHFVDYNIARIVLTVCNRNNSNPKNWCTPIPILECCWLGVNVIQRRGTR